MSTTAQMIKTHPAAGLRQSDALQACIDACLECAQTCTACADACLAEDMVADLRQCIRTDLDCADVCAATGAVLTRLTEPNTLIQRAVLEACAAVCCECAQECERHKDMHEHCTVCAEACRRYEQACRDLLTALGWTDRSGTTTNRSLPAEVSLIHFPAANCRAVPRAEPWRTTRRPPHAPPP